MKFLPSKKFLLLGLVGVMLAVIPLTVYFLQKQQETRSSATASSSLFFSPASTESSPIRKAANETFSIDLMVDPGTNFVSLVKLDLSYDPAFLATADAGLVPNQTAFPAVLEGPVYNNGNILVTVQVGADTSRVITKPTKVATLTFKALTTTSPSTQIRFGNQTQVLSTNKTQDSPGENVLSTSTPATIAIGTPLSPTPTPPGGGATNTPTPPGGGGTATPTSPPATPGVNKPPVCDSLALDRSATGTAPLSLAFTATGSDPDGTISKVTFNFGDGPVQDVTQAGGIGSNSVSVQVAHTYRNPGTFKASAILTDDRGGVSSPSACTQTITVNQGQAGSGGTGGTTETTATSVPTATAVPTNPPQASITPPGPGDAILGAGAVALFFSILGGILFFVL